MRSRTNEKEEDTMFFGNKDKDTRLTDKQYKVLVGGMSKKERKEFERRQEQFHRDRDDDRLEAWLDFEDFCNNNIYRLSSPMDRVHDNVWDGVRILSYNIRYYGTRNGGGRYK